MEALDLILLGAGVLMGVGLNMIISRKRTQADREWFEYQNQLARLSLDRVYGAMGEFLHKMELNTQGPAPSKAELAFLRQCRVMYMNAKEEERKHA